MVNNRHNAQIPAGVGEVGRLTCCGQYLSIAGEFNDQHSVANGTVDGCDCNHGGTSVVALPIAVLDAGVLLGWLGAAKMQVEGDWHIASALLNEAAISEAVHFLVSFHDGDDGALAAYEEWGLATAIALARAQSLPLISFSAVDTPGVLAMRMRRA